MIAAQKVERWAASPFDFVLECLFNLTEDKWRPWVPGTPRPPVAPNGPELWQGQFLKDVARAKIEGKRRFTVRAGHGVGKTTVEAWLILWFVLFHRDLKVPVTANSQDQLRDVVWAEIARWHRDLPDFLRSMVEIKAERVEIVADREGAFAVSRTARPERPEALQGFHARTIAFFIEEASGIEDIIFETAGGALSSTDSWVFMFANPTRTEGYFYRSHHKNREEWRCYHVPCTASYRVDPNYPLQVAREYGEDSAVYRIRVLGEFDAGIDGVIPLSWISPAIGRDVSPNDRAIVWGLDVARFGDDSTALAKRRGNVLLEPVREWRKFDLMQTSGLIVREYSETPLESRPSSINIDVIGLGSGVVDRLRELGLPARGVNVAESPATDTGRYMRMRDELWFLAREWFESRAVSMPMDDGLISELVAPSYKIESSGKLKVESKDDLKKRGVKSPNKADAFCLTFAGGDLAIERRAVVARMHYDPFAVDRADFERVIARQQETAGGDYRPW